MQRAEHKIFDESTIMAEWSKWEELNSVSEHADGTTNRVLALRAFHDKLCGQ